MEFLVFFFISSFTIFTDFYFIIPELTFSNISLLLIFFLFFMHKKEINDFHQTFSKEEQVNLKNILKISFVFIFAVFIINLIHKVSIVYSIKTVLIQSSITLSLPFINFLYYKKNINFMKFINIVIFIHFFFIILQLLGLTVNLTSIFPSNFIIGIYETNQFNKEALRVTGATNNPITLAQQFLAFICISLVRYINQKNLHNLLILSICVLTLLFTQSRAAIFSFIPIMYFSSFIFLKFNIKKLSYLIIISFLSYYLYNIFLSDLQSMFAYTFQDMSLSSTHRFWTNLYISQGVLKESPLIGIPANLAWNIFDQYKDINYNIYLYNRAETPTHHNQIFFYLRYYGLVGLSILIFFYYRLFKTIKDIPNKNISFLLGSILLLDLFFSFTHNNKIFSPMLWIYLSLIFNSRNFKNNL